MESTPLLGNPLPPNTHRILNIGNMHRNYATAYPAMLHRTMNEIDFVNYLKRIDKTGHASKKVLLLLVTPFALFALFTFSLPYHKHPLGFTYMLGFLTRSFCRCIDLCIIFV